MGRIRRATIAGLVLAAVSVLLGSLAASAAESNMHAVGPVSAGLQDFTIDSMDVHYTLTRADDDTSRLTVVESFVVVFPEIDQNHGFQRRIPDSYQGHPVFPELVSITDGEGRDRPQESESDDGDYVMTSREDEFVHGSQTYVFTYTLQNVTASFGDTGDDEFYWDVNGVDWQQPFGEVSATLHVEGDVADALTGNQSCYHGYADSTDHCEISLTSGVDGATQVSAQTSTLYPYQNMTIAVGFEKGTFAPFDDSYLASPWGWLQGVAGVGIVGSLVFGGLVRGRRLKDEPGRPTIIAEYTPPPGIDALESAVLLGLTSKAIPAEVLEQAVVGSIRIVEGERGWLGRTPLQAELIDRSHADGDGRMLLDGLFGAFAGPGAVFEFGRTDTRFSMAAQAILKAATVELSNRGLRREVSAKVRSAPVLLALGSGVLAWVFGIVALGSGVTPWVPISFMVASIPVLFIVAGILARKPLTAKGAEVRDHLRGLKQFIEWAEVDRIKMLQSPQGAERVQINPHDPRQMLRLYQVLLPYAVVFGQEKEWARHLAVLYGDSTPYWYYGTNGFSAASFSSGISSLSSVAASSSSSSSSGGSSGGGSSGGGGGGGGGGGV